MYSTESAMIAARERVEHSAVAHCDAVVDCDGVELTSDAAGRADGLGNDLAHVLEMHVAGYELGVRVRYGNDRLTEVGIRHSCGAPQGSGSGSITSDGGGA